MKNKIYIFFLILTLSILFFTKINSEENFNFNISELEVTEEGNLFKGSNGGEAYTEDGISIKAENFEYNKTSNILKLVRMFYFMIKIKIPQLLQRKFYIIKTLKKL